MDDADLLYSTKAIASFLGMGEKATRHRIASGTIPTFTLPGSRIRCARKSTLTKWLDGLEMAQDATQREGDPGRFLSAGG